MRFHKGPVLKNRYRYGLLSQEVLGKNSGRKMTVHSLQYRCYNKKVFIFSLRLRQWAIL